MKRLILLVLAGLLAATAAQADIIYVQGDVSGTWAADTVIVTGEVRVPPAQTLIIQPGVKVLFQVYCKFIVDNAATLRAIGTALDSIYFDEMSPNMHWKGIRFLNASGSSELSYCVLRHGRAAGSGTDGKGGAIYCSSCSPTIQNCRIEGNSANEGGGIYCFYSSPIIDHCQIANNSSYHRGSGVFCYYNSNPDITNSTITSNSAVGNGGGILCENNSNAFISRNSITGNISGQSGAGIYSFSSAPIIIGNTISRNSTPYIAGWAYRGGGISCQSSNAIINENIIAEDSSFYGGAIAITDYSWLNIHHNLICENLAEYGGGIWCSLSDGNISGNIISRNSGLSNGGGLELSNADPYLAYNMIIGNSSWIGGGIYGTSTDCIIFCNIIAGNEAGHAGGIYLLSLTSYPRIGGVTIARNHSTTNGGGIYNGNCFPILLDCILWCNLPSQIYQGSGGNLQATYCDIQQSWPGFGNINAYPAFVDTAHDDYRLLWGSPCIDTGDPNPVYNDPDGTRADMGAFYYDQSVMVRILLTPHEIPYLIPATGGSMDYTIRASNRDSLAHTAAVWCNVTLPDSSIYGPVLGPVTVTVGAGALLERVRTQNVPAAAPMGVYHYNVYAVVGSDTSKDSFMFGKLGDSGQVLRDPYVAGMTTGNKWQNTGEPITDVGASMTGAGLMNQAPTEFALYPCSPNPFNATTAISYQLSADSFVSLRIYDTAGRMVETLVDGWREAGEHKVTFEADYLPSGMYICRISAGEFVAVQKLVLLK